jgi:hypothetical protein
MDATLLDTDILSEILKQQNTVVAANAPAIWKSMERSPSRRTVDRLKDATEIQRLRIFAVNLT